ncbi:slc38a6, partial [Symbiodinium sp. CCMP2456]
PPETPTSRRSRSAAGPRPSADATRLPPGRAGGATETEPPKRHASASPGMAARAQRAQVPPSPKAPAVLGRFADFERVVLLPPCATHWSQQHSPAPEEKEEPRCDSAASSFKRDLEPILTDALQSSVEEHVLTLRTPPAQAWILHCLWLCEVLDEIRGV